MVGLRAEHRRRFLSNGFGDWGGVAWGGAWQGWGERRFGGFNCLLLGKCYF